MTAPSSPSTSTKYKIPRCIQVPGIFEDIPSYELAPYPWLSQAWLVPSGSCSDSSELVGSSLDRCEAWWKAWQALPHELRPPTVFTGLTHTHSNAHPTGLLMWKWAREKALELDRRDLPKVILGMLALDSYGDISDFSLKLRRVCGSRLWQIKEISVFTDAVHFRRYIVPMRARGFLGKLTNPTVRPRLLSKAGVIAEHAMLAMSIFDPYGFNPLSIAIQNHRLLQGTRIIKPNQ